MTRVKEREMELANKWFALWFGEGKSFFMVALSNHDMYIHCCNEWVECGRNMENKPNW